MVIMWRVRFCIAPELLIARNLIGVQQGAGFQMRRQMNRPQAALQLPDCRRFRREPVGCDVAFCNKLVERLFVRDQFRARRFGGGGHALENRCHLTVLAFGKTELHGEREHMHSFGGPRAERYVASKIFKMLS
jgi:hypothetical protein